MLAFSPPLFSTTYGWPLPLVDDLIADNLLQQDINNGVSMRVEANSYHDHSFVDFPTYDQIQLQRDFASEEETSISSGGAVNIDGTGDDKMVAKKLNHNASERDRRKRVNDLYAFLRSLLPMSSDQKVKVSIPGTVSRALKYIPQLQKEVETLTRKKEKLWSCSSSITDTKKEHLAIKKQGAKEAIIETNLSAVSSVSVLGEKEVVIQLISSTDGMSRRKEIGFLSNVLEYLEQEEEGLVLLNATTFRCFTEGMLLNTLHLQVRGDHKIEAENLKEKLCSFHQ